jgi:hypothetical protein
MHLAKELIPLWEAYVSRQADIDGDIDVAEFFNQLICPTGWYSRSQPVGWPADQFGVLPGRCLISTTMNPKTAI